jgi:hypothetical protein
VAKEEKKGRMRLARRWRRKFEKGEAKNSKKGGKEEDIKLNLGTLSHER